MTIDGALDWINAKGEEFARAGRRIHDGMHRAAVYAGSRPAGSEARAEARKTVERWGALLRAHQTALNRWEAVASKIPGLDGSLGIIPVIPIALAGTVIAIAVSMALLLRKLTAEERALKLLEQGRITPAEAIELAQNLEGGRMGFGLGSFGAVPVLLAAGAVAFFLMRR
ncbi:hypothetical protein LCGC14_2637700 [marine sediment metagenome]|uniref:Uncharacterized protein n=1 Tax=marine sediment metagenome TaxID=412755 RepID=A0A0F8ZYL9_9ZZZZ